MTKHTAGPWKVTHGHGDKNRLVTNSYNVLIADVYSDSPEDLGLPQKFEYPANARLIAAAPALLEVVKHVLAMSDDAYLTGHPEWYEIVKEAAAALAQAEGKS